MARKPFSLRLNKKLFKNVTFEEVTKNMQVATVWARDQVKIKLNRGQPTRITSGGNIIGLDPSKPGEPPKKITSQLQNSIRQDVEADSRTVRGFIGSNLKKAPALELGNRKGTLKPRPHFRPVLVENKNKLAEIIAKGIAGI